MKVDKINTDYKTNLTIKNHFYMKTPEGGEKVVNKQLSKTTNEIVEMNGVLRKIVDSVDSSCIEIDVDNFKVIKNLVQGKSQLLFDKINIMDDNSIDIFIKDGNVITIKNMEEFISLKDALELANNDEIDQPIRQLELKLMNKNSSFILMNGKATNLAEPLEGRSYKLPTRNLEVNNLMNEFIAIDKQGKSMVLFIPQLGFLYLDNNTLKRVIYHLPYLSSLHEYTYKFSIIDFIQKYNWRIIIVLILLVLVLIKGR